MRRVALAVVLGGLSVLCPALVAQPARAAGGDELWLSRYGSETGGRAAAVAVSPDGTHVYVTGAARDPVGSGTDLTTVGYDARTGAQLWADRFNASLLGISLDGADAIAVSPDGTRVYVA